MGITLKQLTNAISKLKEYADNKFPVVNPDESNAIIKTENGIFVEDKAEEIQTLTNNLNVIAKYQKYLNTELDYAHVLFSKETTVNNATVGTVIPFDKIIASNNITFDSSINAFILKAGKTYKVTADLRMSSPTGGYFYFLIRNKTKGVYLGAAGCVETPKSYSIYVAHKPAEAIIKCDEDTEIQAVVCSIDTTRTLAFTTSCSMLVQEINRQIVIDPVEHVNTTQGLEDTPVGHIISHMGTIAPKHYLICDGAEYSINDYPYLSQHIIDNFGIVNHFGGDGITTFAVPDLRGEFLRGTGTATRDTGSGAEVGEHQDPTQHINNYISNYGKGLYTPVYTNYNDLGRAEVQIENPDTTVTGSTGVNSVSGTYQTNSSYTNLVVNYSSRPTNTSVLYCIKYEPTYYTSVQNTNYLSASLYSLEERVIGSWIDGKPLYEKTIVTAIPKATALGTNSQTSINSNIENVEQMTKINIQVISSSGFAFSAPWVETSSDIIYGVYAYYINENSQFKLTNSNPDYNDSSVYITAQYTKTIDAENSFTLDMLSNISTLNTIASDEEVNEVIGGI